MKLQPNDILQKGDVIHFGAGQTLVIDGLASFPAYLSQLIDRSAVYVERPDPDLREHVRILRMALISVLDDLSEVSRNGYQRARAALEATK